MLTMGDVSRFARGKHVASYLGLIPREHSSGADGRNWARLPSRATACCECCWWKRRRSRCALIPDSAKSICIAAIRNRKQWPKWQRGAPAVGRTTVLDAAHAKAVSGSRSHREQPAGAPGRRKLDRRIDWALSHPVETGCSHRRIMADEQGRIDGWWNDVPPQSDLA